MEGIASAKEPRADDLIRFRRVIVIAVLPEIVVVDYQIAAILGMEKQASQTQEPIIREKGCME
jgi:uncharacterized membrane protein